MYVIARVNRLCQAWPGDAYQYCIRYWYSSVSSANPLKRSLGQPTSHTHPFLMKEDEVTPGLTRDDYAQRRKELMKLLSEKKPESDRGHNSSENVVVLFGEPVIYMSEDVPYPFHQNSNFRYLTGFLEPNSCLIMKSIPGGSSSDHNSLLLVPERDPHGELWHGPRAGSDGALALTDVTSTDTIDKFSDIIKSYLDKDCIIWYDFQKPINFNFHMKYMRSFLTDAYNNKMKICPVGDLIQRLRHIKTEKEILLMMEAANITADAFKRAMPACFPDMNEYQLHAMIECECKLRGAHMLAYPPVVAGGSRANTLHYICNNQRIKDGEMVLVDAGADYHGYVTDITRTWPINGRFSPAQRKVYDAVLRVQKACIDLCKPGTSLDFIYNVMALLLAHELYQLGIVKNKPTDVSAHEASRKYCPHHVSHWLGMDVHDTASIPRSVPLHPGMVVTIEPGIYVHHDDISVPDEFRGIGIRIEDDVVVTSESPIVLTAACPKEPDVIEALMMSS